MWEQQAGRVVETGIEGTGTTPDFWKYLRKEIQELGVTVPLRVQMDIDNLCEGCAIPIRKPLEDSSGTFLSELTALCRKHDRFLVGPEGLVVATASEARHYNVGHRPLKGEYTPGVWKGNWMSISLQ